jgi:hypothetical protein
MKKLLVLVAVLALVAVLVVPMAASAEAQNVNINGTVQSVPTVITLIAPGPISNWNLSGNGYLLVGTNYGAAADGSVVYTQGNDTVRGWALTAMVASNYIDTDSLAHMWAGSFLPTAIELSNDGGGSFYQFGASSVFPYSGTTNGTTTLKLEAQQVVNTEDVAGAYGLVVVYTITPTY